MRDDTLLPSAIAAIGNTPLVELSRITANLDGRIFAKLDYLNPGSSKKDRIARQIIEDARRRQPGARSAVIELTSGNTGTGAAIVCAVLGHPLTVVMSAGNSPECARMMRALGADVVIVAQAAGSPPGQVSGDDLALVEAEVTRLTDRLGAFRIDQFNQAGNRRAHEQHTAREIWSAANGMVTAFCDFIGTGGTFAGLWHGFRAIDPRIAGYVLEPAGAAILQSGTASAPSHRIQGGGYAIESLAQLHGSRPDGFLTVTDDAAIVAARRLAREEGIFAGFSSGANLAGALALLDGPAAGGNIAIMICDSGLKYLSTDLWQ